MLEVHMGSRSKCRCWENFDESEIDFTNHHPKCKYFNFGSELQSLQQQCFHFLELANKYRKLYEDLRKENEE